MLGRVIKKMLGVAEERGRKVSCGCRKRKPSLSR